MATLENLLLGVMTLLATLAIASGAITTVKHRSPLEGVLLGFLLGPVGLAIALSRPYRHRPPVDRGAHDSYHSLLVHQTRVETTHAQLRQWQRPAA